MVSNLGKQKLSSEEITCGWAFAGPMERKNVECKGWGLKLRLKYAGFQLMHMEDRVRLP